jgi:hypothetical protein
MQAVQDAEVYLEDVDSNEEEVAGSHGAQRVLKLALILLILLLGTAVFFFVLLPMFQPAMPPLAPAVQV